MGKKGSWFSALKRVLNRKKKDSEEDKKEKREKKGFQKLRNRDSSSIISLFRKPSSIEKILSDVDKDQQETTTNTIHKIDSPQNDSLGEERKKSIAAIKIQKDYRGYLARRSARARRGLMRLRNVVGSQSVKRQTTNALRCMQLLVRVQSQIRLRRLQMLEKPKDKAVESRWGEASEAADQDWDDSRLTKEQIEARSRRKAEAIVRRERSATYAYSNQLLRSRFRHGELPPWWNWLEIPIPANIDAKISDRASSVSSRRRSLQTKHKQVSSPISRSPIMSKYCKSRFSVTDSASDAPFKDDDSLTSCPPFSLPHYLTPTASAMAKMRANNEAGAKRRLSYPLTGGKWSRASPSQKLPSNSPVSVNSASSLPASLGRKPFNRFV